MGWRNFPAELWMLCCVEACLYLPQMRWRYMDCSTAASMDSTNMLHMSENWVHQGLNRQVNVVGFFAMLASFNVLTQREVLNLFIPHLSWAMEGYPPQRQVHSGQQTLFARYWGLSKLRLLVSADAIPGENLPPGPFSSPCSMSLRKRDVQCGCRIRGGHRSVMGAFVYWRCPA